MPTASTLMNPNLFLAPLVVDAMRARPTVEPYRLTAHHETAYRLPIIIHTIYPVLVTVVKIISHILDLLDFQGYRNRYSIHQVPYFIASCVGFSLFILSLIPVSSSRHH